MNSLAQLLSETKTFYVWSDLARTKIAFSLTFSPHPLLDGNKMTETSKSTYQCLVFEGKFRDDPGHFRLEVLPTNDDKIRHTIRLYVGGKITKEYIGDLYIFQKFKDIGQRKIYVD